MLGIKTAIVSAMRKAADIFVGGDVRLQLCGYPIRIGDSNDSYEVIFVWVNDECRTVHDACIHLGLPLRKRLAASR